MKTVRIAVLLMVALAACSGVSAAERRTVDAYTKTVAPLSKEGGRIVVQEIRPSLGDLTSGEITPDQFRRFAQGWKSGMEGVRRGFAEAPTNARLRPIADVFDESFELYLNAIDLFVAASTKTGKALQDAISAAIPTAEKADKTYDRAVDMLGKERKRVGLPPASAP